MQEQAQLLLLILFCFVRQHKEATEKQKTQGAGKMVVAYSIVLQR